jgi:hypothetical protein
MFDNFENKIINCLLYEPISDSDNFRLKQTPKIICFQRKNPIERNIAYLCCYICLEKKCDNDNYLSCDMLICNNCIYKISICPICNTKNCIEMQYEAQAEKINNIKNV